MKYIKMILILCGYFAWMNAQAAVNIELTKGVGGTIPVAILPFSGQVYNKTDSQNITAVIERDFNQSGRLKAIVDANAPQILLTPSYWQKLGADYVLKGEITPQTDGRFQVSVMLQDVSAQAKTGVPVALTIFSQNYWAKSSQFRSLAHHIGDDIYQKLTSERGIFSTRMAYIYVEPAMKNKKFTLTVADYDGFNPRTLVSAFHPLMSPAWSADGKSLAYVSFENRRSQIYISDVETGKRRLISDYPGINGAPAFSANGQKLAVALSKKEAQPHIYLVNLQNNALEQVTRGWAIDTEPAFSKDGQNLIFTSDRGGNPQIYQANIGSGTLERLTYDGNYNSSASFSPDGKQILLLHRESKNFNIALLDLENGRIFELTENGGMNDSPSFAPNGSLVLYATRTGSKSMLEVVSVDGQIKWRLPSRGGDMQEPVWSPFL